MKKYDVGLYGLWYGRNYGSILTYYALKNVVNEMGYSTVFICNPHKIEPDDVSQLVRSHPMRFAAEHYEQTAHLKLHEMSAHNDVCEKFLLGSDQMWRYELSRPYQFSYFFDFANDDSTKIAYGASFGSAPYTAPEDYRARAKECLERFDGISVRDEVSRKILEEDFGITAKTVMDPVFLCPIDKYNALTDTVKDFSVPNEYIFAYVLDPTPDIGQSLCRIAEEQNIKIVVAFDELGDKQELKNALQLTSDKVIGMGDLTAAEWLYLFKNARFVLTNSFHGTCFSIIYQKPFVALINAERGAERFSFLLSQFGLTEHLSTTSAEMYQKFNSFGIDYSVDYTKAYETAAPHIRFSKSWLQLKLGSSGICGKNNCVGCGACVSTCPKQCISLKPDDHGFYRAVIDQQACINCEMCKKVCPVLSPSQNQNTEQPRLYEFIAADDSTVTNSSSGGAFSVFATEVLNQKGIVVGAAWRDDFSVAHTIIEHEEDLWKIQKSKYLQSYIGDIFKEVKNHLQTKRLVLFAGCPCQIAGLKSYLKKDYKNLILIDILCASAPSAMFFQKYLDDEYHGNIKKYTFRYKDENQTWNCFTTRADLSDGSSIIKKTRPEDTYQRAFHSHTMTPFHCQHCKFQGRHRHGDISLGDFWGIEKKEPNLNTKQGVSALIVNSDKGANFLKSVPSKRIKLLKQVPLDWIGGNGLMANNSNFISPYRDAFFKAILRMPFGKALETSLKTDSSASIQSSIPKKDLNPLQFAPNLKYFSFDPAIWKESSLDGKPILSVLPANPGFGKYASIRLQSPLFKEKHYRLYVKFKFKTSSPVINFHVKDSGSKQHQVIYSYNHSTVSIPSDWVEIACDFTPNADIYDEFMIGAAHFVGKDNFIIFDYIYVVEQK